MKTNFSKNLKKYRLYSGYTQVALAKAIGISRRTLQVYEHSEVEARDCTMRTLVRLTKVLNIDVKHLLFKNQQHYSCSCGRLLFIEGR